MKFVTYLILLIRSKKSILIDRIVGLELSGLTMLSVVKMGSTLDIGTRPDESAVQQAGSVEFSAHGREAVITPEQPGG